MPRFASRFPALPALGLLLLFTACGEPLQPCTDCPEVAGTYALVADPATVESGDSSDPICSAVDFPGATAEVTVEQEGSALYLSGYLEVSGTLWEDGTINFDSVTVGTTPVGPVTARVAARFAPEGGRKIIRGWLRLEVPDYDCKVGSVLTLTEI